ncbi:MAG: hypothetical protein WC307_06125 [Candidatus Nanoarchaeia archaeon]|jgi:hypothetical protein
MSQFIEAVFKVELPDTYTEDEVFNYLKEVALKQGLELVQWS